MVVLEVMVSWPPVRQPAPLPGWAVSLGAFLAATSLLQVATDLYINDKHNNLPGEKEAPGAELYYMKGRCSD
jgi:hypothetical protein